MITFRRRKAQQPPLMAVLFAHLLSKLKDLYNLDQVLDLSLEPRSMNPLLVKQPFQEEALPMRLKLEALLPLPVDCSL